jgi:hypothetical protein
MAAGPFDINGIAAATFYVNGYSLDPAVWPAPAYSDILDEIKKDGANWTALSSWAKIDLTTGSVTDYHNQGYDDTASFSSIGPAVALAHAPGLKVMLKPMIGTFHQNGQFSNLLQIVPGEALTISNPSAFFAGYKNYILQWAQLAAQYDADLLSLGTEMAAATKPKYASYWKDIIASVRKVYQGPLTYSAFLGNAAFPNQFNDEVAQIQFWPELDYIGMDVYPNLTDHADPSVAELVAAWQETTASANYGTPAKWVQYINQLATTIGKPVIFTETGICSYPGANKNPGSPAPQGATVDYGEQNNWWEAFFETWAVNPPHWLAGIFVQNEDPEFWPGPHVSSYRNVSFQIDGKPAEKTIAYWFDTQQKLTVTPTSKIAATGIQGGPFSPLSFSYTLAASTGSVSYSITNIPKWLTASSTSGTVTTSGTTVTFTVNAFAATRTPGKYERSIDFNNTTNKRGNAARNAILTVNP